MLGELENYSGNISAQGKMYYVSQQAWIFPATLRQNILFGMPYVKEKFDKVIDVCSLKRVSNSNIIFVSFNWFIEYLIKWFVFEDLELLAYGEETLLGEKGINLSGGQRARVNM
jgi:ABC-type multidrug transport system fused ATPase/permease subunit